MTLKENDSGDQFCTRCAAGPFDYRLATCPKCSETPISPPVELLDEIADVIFDAIPDAVKCSHRGDNVEWLFIDANARYCFANAIARWMERRDADAKLREKALRWACWSWGHPHYATEPPCPTGEEFATVQRSFGYEPWDVGPNPSNGGNP